MPVPRKGESRQDFVSRCVPIVMDEGTAKDNKQAVAVCYSLYKNKKTGKVKAEQDILEIKDALAKELRDRDNAK